MFYFKDKFNISSPFQWDVQFDQGELVSQSNSHHVHYGYDYTQLDKLCPEAGLYVKTKDIQHIPGFAASTDLNQFEDNHYQNGQIDKEKLFLIDADPQSAFLKPDAKYEFIKLSDHLEQGENDGADLHLKNSDFHYVLKGDFLFQNGKAKKIELLYVHERYIVSQQMDLYLEIDQNVRDALMEDIRYTPEHAHQIFDIIKRHKGLEKIFDLEDTRNNTERFCLSTEGKDPDAAAYLDRYEIKEKVALALLYPDGYMKGGVLKMDHDKFMTYDENFELEEFQNIEVEVDGVKEKKYQKAKVVFPVSSLQYDYLGMIQFGIPGDISGTKDIYSEKNPRKLYPHLEYLNELVLIVTHEYIHAMQSLLDPAFQGDRDIGQIDEQALGYQKEKYKIPHQGGKKIDHHIRRSFRELFAHHFCIFPNKKYDSPSDDPVFKFTEFVRGDTAIFGGISEYKVAFWIFRGIDYADYLSNRLASYYNKELVAAAEDASKDVYKAKRCYEHKGWAFPNEEARGKPIKEVIEIFKNANIEMLKKYEHLEINDPELNVDEEDPSTEETTD